MRRRRVKGGGMSGASLELLRNVCAGVHASGLAAAAQEVEPLGAAVKGENGAGQPCIFHDSGYDFLPGRPEK
jgi:hypothetical protein